MGLGDRGSSLVARLDGYDRITITFSRNEDLSKNSDRIEYSWTSDTAEEIQGGDTKPVYTESTTQPNPDLDLDLTGEH